MIPLVVYDELWLPYIDLADPIGIEKSIWRDIGFFVHIADLERWLQYDLPTILVDTERLRSMQKRIFEVRDTHFTFDATVRAIDHFIDQLGTDERLLVGPTSGTEADWPDEPGRLICVPRPAPPLEWAGT
jgi:hypothetical protein